MCPATHLEVSVRILNSELNRSHNPSTETLKIYNKNRIGFISSNSIGKTWFTSKPKHSKLPHEFYFDDIYNTECDDNQVFHTTISPKLNAVLNGENSSVWFYGTREQNSYSNFITLTAFKLFTEITAPINSHMTVFSIQVKFIEIYNDKIIDLLRKPTTESLEDKKLRLGLLGSSEYCVYGVTCEVVENPERLIALFGNGHGRLSAHDEASRGHTFLEIIVNQRQRASGVLKTSSLTLVNLVESTQTKGKELVATVDKSLNVLNNCLLAIADHKKYVPFRESTVTGLLQSSLTGTKSTAVLLTCSSLQEHTNVTLDTLQFGNRLLQASSRSLNLTLGKNKPLYLSKSNDDMIANYETLRAKLHVLERIVAERFPNVGCMWGDGSILDVPPEQLVEGIYRNSVNEYCSNLKSSGDKDYNYDGSDSELSTSDTDFSPVNMNVNYKGGLSRDNILPPPQGGVHSRIQFVDLSPNKDEMSFGKHDLTFTNKEGSISPFI